MTALEGLRAEAEAQGKTPPTDACLRLAERLLAHIEQRGVSPDRVVPNADGGVTFFFASGGYISADNDEDIAAFMWRNGRPDVWLVDFTAGGTTIDATLDRILTAQGGQ